MAAKAAFNPVLFYRNRPFRKSSNKKIANFENLLLTNGRRVIIIVERL